VFVFDPAWHGDTQEELRFLLDLVRQVGPAVYNVYLLHRLRRRAGAAERARFARELHDGAVQSLIAVEMQVDVLASGREYACKWSAANWDASKVCCARKS
jgi:signal transduction histidine kinase